MFKSLALPDENEAWVLHEGTGERVLGPFKDVRTALDLSEALNCAYSLSRKQGWDKVLRLLDEGVR